MSEVGTVIERINVTVDQEEGWINATIRGRIGGYDFSLMAREDYETPGCSLPGGSLPLVVSLREENLSELMTASILSGATFSNREEFISGLEADLDAGMRDRKPEVRVSGETYTPVVCVSAPELGPDRITDKLIVPLREEFLIRYLFN